MMNIMAWNVRGAANTDLFSNLKQFVDIHMPDILIIVELRVDPSKLQRTLLLLGFATRNGYAGGIIIAWKDHNLSIKVLKTTFQFIHVEVCIKGEQVWFLSAVYASPHERERKVMWEELLAIAEKIQGDWLLAGDFNDIACASEKKGGGAIPYNSIARFIDNQAKMEKPSSSQTSLLTINILVQNTII